MITWWPKLGGNLPLGRDALLVSISGTRSFICPVAQTRLDIPRSLITQSHRHGWAYQGLYLPSSFHLPFYLKIFTIVWKNIGKSVFVAVQDSCTYAGTKLCLNDHYLCETFCLGWTIHHCNTTPMWGLISLQVLIEHLSQLACMPTYGTATRDFRHQTAVYLESLLWHEFNSNCSLPCRCHFKDRVWTPAIPSLTAGPGWVNNQWTACHYSLYHMTLFY